MSTEIVTDISKEFPASLPKRKVATLTGLLNAKNSLFSVAGRYLPVDTA
jgi:hypothetical protein